MSLQDLLPPQLRITAYRYNSYNVPFSLQKLDGIECLVSLITSRFQETTRVYDNNIGILGLGTHQSGWFCRNDLAQHCLAVSQVLCTPETDNADSRPTVYALVNHTQGS